MLKQTSKKRWGTICLPAMRESSKSRMIWESAENHLGNPKGTWKWRKILEKGQLQLEKRQPNGLKVCSIWWARRASSLPRRRNHKKECLLLIRVSTFHNFEHQPTCLCTTLAFVNWRQFGSIETIICKLKPYPLRQVSIRCFAFMALRPGLWLDIACHAPPLAGLCPACCGVCWWSLTWLLAGEVSTAHFHHRTFFQARTHYALWKFMEHVSQANPFRLPSRAAFWLRASWKDCHSPSWKVSFFQCWNLKHRMIHTWFHTISSFSTPFWFVSKAVRNRLRLRPMEMFFFRTGDMLPLVTSSARTTSNETRYWTFMRLHHTSNFDSMTETAFFHCSLRMLFAFSHFCHQCLAPIHPVDSTTLRSSLELSGLSHHLAV